MQEMLGFNSYSMGKIVGSTKTYNYSQNGDHEWKIN